MTGATMDELLLLPGDSADAVKRKQAQFDRDVFMDAVAAWIKEKRDSGVKIQVFPKALYMNKTVWENDGVGENLHILCADMKIEVRTSYNLPPDTFHFTDQVYPTRDVVVYVKEYGKLPDGITI